MQFDSLPHIRKVYAAHWLEWIRQRSIPSSNGEISTGYCECICPGFVMFCKWDLRIIRFSVLNQCSKPQSFHIEAWRNFTLCNTQKWWFVSSSQYIDGVKEVIIERIYLKNNHPHEKYTRTLLNDATNGKKRHKNNNIKIWRATGTFRKYSAPLLVLYSTSTFSAENDISLPVGYSLLLQHTKTYILLCII